MKSTMMRIYHFSDSHGYHRQLKIPGNIDVVIFSGDESNNRDPYHNEPETRDFLEWFAALEIRFKVFVAGNHSTAIEKGLVPRREIELLGIRYLENEAVEIEGIRMWGSPFSPTFGDWSFMKSRSKLPLIWEQIPEDIDILITHTPPMGVLDLTYGRDGKLEFCGCRNLLKQIERVKPRLHLFGHIHNYRDIRNSGFTSLSGLDTVFSNGSVVTDLKFGKVTSHGNVFTL